MVSFYDTFDYPSYWKGREYEHTSETLALNFFLEKIPKIKSLLEIGAGYGRLTPQYVFRAEKVILSDPSAKLLKIARNNFPLKKIKFIHSSIFNLPKKIRKNSQDLIIMVRVLHHIDDLDNAFSIISNLLKKNGYLILEFPNKKHMKATIKEFFRGNFTFPLEIFPKELSKPKRIPFKNYHPDLILEKLKSNKLTPLEVRSVSNIRSPFLKKIIPQEILILIEKKLQKPLSKFFFGPSIFILAQKTKD